MTRIAGEAPKSYDEFGSVLDDCPIADIRKADYHREVCSESRQAELAE
jgi:hypothetical protein